MKLITNGITKFKTGTTINKVSTILWGITLLALIAFVVTIATLTSTTAFAADVKTSVALGFVIILFAALLTTILPRVKWRANKHD